MTSELQSKMRTVHRMEAEEELAKETIRAFKAGLHGEEYDNPFTEVEEGAEREKSRLDEAEPGTREGDPKRA
jgi:hypothetical protein